MPPRYVYWTIIAGGLPTAFRAAERDELLPTFKRLKEKHPDAELKYFAQGRLWTSQEEAREAREAARAPRPAPRGEARGRDWRPGGEHRDPRQKFIDQKKERNQRWRQERFDKKSSGPNQRGIDAPRRDRRPPIDKPQGDPLRKEAPASPERRPWNNRPPRQDWRNKPARQDWRAERPDSKRPAPARPSGHRPPPPSHPANYDGGGKNRSWRDRPHGQTREDKPPRGPRPDREPRRGDEDPNRPPRPSEPRTDPPGPPERGRSGPPRGGARGPRRPFKKNSR